MRRYTTSKTGIRSLNKNIDHRMDDGKNITLIFIAEIEQDLKYPFRVRFTFALLIDYSLIRKSVRSGNN